MSYNPTNWVNGQTPISDSNLNHIEQGIKTVSDLSDAQESKIADIANNQIPETYLQQSVDNYIKNNQAGLATKTDVNNLDNKLSSEIADVQSEIEGITDLFSNPNLIDLSNLTRGYYINHGGGALLQSEWFSATDYIDLTGISKIRVSNGVGQFAYYDENKQYVSGVNIADATHDEFTYEKPSGVTYARFTLANWGVDNNSVYVYDYNRIEKDFDKLSIIECGIGKQFTNLRSAIAKGVELGCKVVVYPNTYDLATEFADVIANQSGKGIELGNGVEVVFLAGSYVKAIFDNTNEWIYRNFEPFWSSGDFILDGLNIEAQNTRYCVHDEHSGVGTYHHVFKNCIMKYTSTYATQIYGQCIGGGLGEHGYIDIIGGKYTAIGTVELNLPITYHNGFAQTCDGRIFIKDVYLSDKGQFRFGMHGTSTIKTPIIINGCSMGGDIILFYEGGEVENFELTEWNNEIRQ